MIFIAVLLTSNVASAAKTERFKDRAGKGEELARLLEGLKVEEASRTQQNK